MVEKINFGVICEPHVAEMHEGKLPEMGREDILIKLLACNICTADYQQWMGLRNHQGFPMAGGHECVGVIEEMGADVISEFQIGDLVGVDLETFCGICPDCRRGNETDCKNINERKIGADGYYGSKCFATYRIIDQKHVIRFDRKDIPLGEACFLEPLSTVIQGVKKVNVRPMEDVVVVGAGTMGLVNAQVAKAYGARVIISDISKKKIERAKSMGIADVVDASAGDPVEQVKELTNGRGADTVIAAVGNTIAYKQGLDMLKEYRGKFLVFPAGFPKPEMDIDPNTLHYRRMELIGTFNSNLSDFQDAAVMISKKLVDMSYSLEGKTFPLRDIQKAYEAAATPDTYRITVDLQGV